MSASILSHLALARRVADYADRLGVQGASVSSRATFDHLGAALADAILQAGVNYRTVVQVRVERILSQFPETATLSGLTPFIENEGAYDFLLWSHHVKVRRFVSLAQLAKVQGIETTFDLKRWLCRGEAREHMLALNGIGPKTYDYLSCIVGIDCIAVDRHTKVFANEAGVALSSYDDFKSVFTYAADLLNIARRDFDAWIWRTVSARKALDPQLTLI